MTDTPSMRRLLDSLTADGHLRDPGRAGRLIAACRARDELPLYLRTVIGVGAFIASGSLVAALFISGLVNLGSPVHLGITGALFMVLAIGQLRAANRGSGEAFSCFVLQCSFFAMAVGKTLFTAATSEVVDSGWGIPLGVTLASAASLPFYRASIDCFGSLLAVLVSLYLLMVIDLRSEAVGGYLQVALFAACLAGAALAFGWPHGGAAARPFGYAFVTMPVLMALGLDLDLERIGGSYASIEVTRLPIRILMTAGLAAAVVWAAGGMTRLRSEAVLAALAGVAALGWLASPGVLAGIGLLVYGHALRERLMAAAGAVFFVAFLGFYYYALNLDLAAKALVLVSSGAVLLAARAYLRIRRFA